MATYILSDATIVTHYKNTLVSGWKCYLMEKSLNVPNVSGNVHAHQPSVLTVGSMREASEKRSLNIGTLLPNLVLYNDPIPQPSTTTTTIVIPSDVKNKPELVLIFATSLKL